uniref:G-protein coupled receptors family 1 profile domain-containing protein n=1 Tax=Plectus sambesii TaxID=2011161 RepID=A0A914V4F8_9BILA
MSLPLRNRTDGRVEQIVDPLVVDNMIISWVLYGVEGCILTATNFPIVIAVLFYSKLRQQKEYVIIGARALADGIAGFGFLLAAVGRILAVQNGNGFVLITRWQCLMTPWVILWGWCQPLTALMLTVVSLDRIIAVTFPLKYYGFTHRYAFTMVGCAYGYVFIPFIVMVYRSYQVTIPDVPAYCSSFHGMTAADYAYFTNFVLAATVVSVLLYIPVLLKLKYTLKNNTAIDSSIKFHRLKRATITLGISSLFTFLFYIVPMAIITFSREIQILTDILIKPMKSSIMKIIAVLLVAVCIASLDAACSPKCKCPKGLIVIKPCEEPWCLPMCQSPDGKTDTGRSRRFIYNLL